MAEPAPGGPAALRLFVAVTPPPDVLAVIAALDRPERPSVRWTTPDQWHVTLQFLGSVPTDRVPSILDALAPVGWTAPFPARVGEETGRFRRSVLHVPVAGLEPLAASVRGALAPVGFEPQEREPPFAGHLTLARGRGPHGSPEIPRLAGEPIEPRAWTVDRFSLVSSVLGRTGSTYSDVAVFPLMGRP